MTTFELTLRRLVRGSTFVGNSGTPGAILACDGFSIENSTISGNAGNGIETMPFEEATLTNVTIVGNSGAGVFVGGSNTTLLVNVIVAGNAPDCTNAGTLTLVGVVFTTDGTCTGSAQRTVTIAQLNLGALAANGGATQTRALGSGSIAIA